VSQPFRDEYAAALDRAEQLARENEDLRREVARVRVSTEGQPAPLPPAGPPDSLKERTLERLDELSTQIDAHAQEAAPAAAASSFRAAASASEAASPAVPVTRVAAPMLPLTPNSGPPVSLLNAEPPAPEAWRLRTQLRDAEARAGEAEALVARLTTEIARLRARAWVLPMGAFVVLAVLAGILAIVR
jgi:hypothetical protein